MCDVTKEPRNFFPMLFFFPLSNLHLPENELTELRDNLGRVGKVCNFIFFIHQKIQQYRVFLKYMLASKYFYKSLFICLLEEESDFSFLLFSHLILKLEYQGSVCIAEASRAPLSEFCETCLGKLKCCIRYFLSLFAGYSKQTKKCLGS